MFWILMVLLAIVLIYLVLCMVIYQNNSLVERLDFETQEPDSFFQHQSQAFLNYHQEMLQNGFQLHKTLYTFNLNQDIHMAIYQHPQHLFIANITDLKHRQTNLHCVYAELGEFFSDGSALSVNNNNHFPPSYANIIPKKIRLTFPNQPIKMLLENQATIRQKHKANVKSIDKLAKSSIEEVINTYLKEESQYLVKIGWCDAECNEKGEHRITFWGAVNMTWRCLPILTRPLLKYQEWFAKRYL